MHEVRSLYWLSKFCCINSCSIVHVSSSEHFVCRHIFFLDISYQTCKVHTVKMLSSLIGAKEKLPFAPFVNSNYLALSYQLVLSGTTEGGGKCVLYL